MYYTSHILSSKFVGFQLLAYIYRVENSVDLDQQADFDSSRMFAHDIINDSLLKALYCQINYHNVFSQFNFVSNKFVFYVSLSKRRGAYWFWCGCYWHDPLL